ncbi:MAG: Crp/Fnr family transcriptional regulator [Candidatus Omnitrophica bacterium]|nr:Crp/Fnr family transcriptional regulator [Candidatus Omnitrophota bacterium]
MPRRHALELFLKQVQMFRHLSAAERQRAAAACRERSFDRGEAIFHEGHPSDSVWLVREGRVHLLHYLTGGRVQTTCVMAPGESFCCLPALDRGSYPATAVAATPAKVIQLPTSVFHELMQGSPAMAQETLCTFCTRLRQVEAKGCLAHDPVDRRIAQALLTLQKKFGETIPMTRQEIADLVGTTVETAIRTISRFQKEGRVRSTRGKLALLQPDALKQLLS